MVTIARPVQAPVIHPPKLKAVIDGSSSNGRRPSSVGDSRAIATEPGSIQLRLLTADLAISHFEALALIKSQHSRLSGPKPWMLI